MFHGDVSKDIAAGILELQQRAIKPAGIPPSKLDETINIASWNIREFGKKQRLEASVHYIAEIMGQFDLISIVELRKQVNDLKRVIEILGPYWRVVYSDYIDDPGGNSERVAFVYDQRAVAFTGFVGNAEEHRAKTGSEWIAAPYSWWRKPYMCGFMAGNFDFIMVATHIRWGAKEEERIPELQQMADWVDRRSKDPNALDKDIIVVGDFNIPKIGDDLYKALTSKGLSMPDALGADKIPGTNLAETMRYDQILYLPKYTKTLKKDCGGTVNFNKCDRKILYPNNAEAQDKRFTYEMSDHLPLWIQIGTDWDDIHMDQILRPKKYETDEHNLKVGNPTVPASKRRATKAKPKRAKRAAPKAKAAKKRR
jgi:hypothetical protein